MKLVLLFAMGIFSGFSAASQENKKPDCSILKNGKFKYLDIPDTTAWFEISGENHVEYHRNGMFYIKSKIRWVNDCSYEMLMLENTIPGFPFKKGDIMLVEVQQISGRLISYSSQVKEEKWYGRLLKIN